MLEYWQVHREGAEGHWLITLEIWWSGAAAESTDATNRASSIAVRAIGLLPPRRKGTTAWYYIGEQDETRRKMPALVKAAHVDKKGGKKHHIEAETTPMVKTSEMDEDDRQPDEFHNLSNVGTISCDTMVDGGEGAGSSSSGHTISSAESARVVDKSQLKIGKLLLKEQDKRYLKMEANQKKLMQELRRDILKMVDQKIDHRMSFARCPSHSPTTISASSAFTTMRLSFSTPPMRRATRGDPLCCPPGLRDPQQERCQASCRHPPPTIDRGGAPPADFGQHFV